VVEAESTEEANKMAYEAWQEEVNNGAMYEAEKWTEKEAYKNSLLTDDEEADYEKKHFGVGDD
jgi:hypothetical protein